ncbi:Hsp70 family protein [Dactylosporangium roseum]|uniref:Hsp70 family protein n=1 Tax=Dactylosporangium roseum TaxID=47989 RepID=A0ABY5ZCN7_9ACTN|nr:Hsp70 family protein [Dactylosporangium roseum]UWZ38099.1 Hsp70 family protein [Dactylosporangium roseum]
MVALGVDFGTSHTVAVARWPDGRVRPLLFDGSPLLPSAVFCEPGDADLVVGRDALHSARREPSLFEPNPKRRIDDGSVLLGERDVTVHALLTAVFQRVLAEFTRTAGGAPTAVTVTHPAGWAATRRKVLKDAARAAGLTGAVLVPEPVAAATYFVRVLRHMVPVGSAVVVYDLGAGTFDGSVVARTAEGFEVRAVGGRDDLGGLDFDEAVLTLIGRSCPAADRQRLTAPSTVEEARAARLLREEAREAKERLSRTSAVTVLVPLLDVDVQLTRDEFEAAARPLVERSVRVLTETVRLSKVASDRIAGIFLVGGASQMPLVATELHRAFGRAPVMIEQPELVVAEGSVLVGPAVRPRSAKPSTEIVPASPAPVLPPRSPAGPAPGSPVPPPVSPGPAGVVPHSPPSPRRRPVSPAAVPMTRPGPPFVPVPQPIRVVYPPPQVVYVPQYVLPPVPPPPRRRPPWSIRWPARFMTLYAVLLFIFVALALLVQVVEPETRDQAEWRQLRGDALQLAIAGAILASLLIHAARRLRRGTNGHLWYPLLLCGTLGVGAVVTGLGHRSAEALGAVFLASTVFLLLPTARAWVRKPPRAPEPDTSEGTES